MKAFLSYFAGFTAATILFAVHSWLEHGHGFHPLLGAALLAAQTFTIVLINKD